MKFMKKSETTTEAKPATKLDEHEGYRHATLKLEQLRNYLALQKKELAEMDQRNVRAGQDVRMYLLRPIMVLSLSSMEMDSVARQVISAGVVNKDLLRELRLQAPKPGFQDEYDAQVVSDYGDKKAIIELVQHAIKLQEKEVNAQKLLAVEQFNASSREDRQRIISKLASAIVQLSQAITEEKRFERFLSLCDPLLAHTMRPGLFPVTLLENPDIYQWLKESADAGMLTEEQRNALDCLFSESSQVVSA